MKRPTLGALAKAGLKITEFFLDRRRPAEERAKSMLGRARNMRRDLERIRTEIRRHEIGSTNAKTKKTRRHHARFVRRLDRKHARIAARALWWENQAARVSP